MILGYKKFFDDGTPTDFKTKIFSGIKIHSLREGHRWRAGASIEMAHGVRTKQYDQFNKDHPALQTCISVQDVFMTYNYALEITVATNHYLEPLEIDILIANDGLSRSQFIKWFFPKEKDEWSGQIIHWTDFKY